jgi:hypothetical protein
MRFLQTLGTSNAVNGGASALNSATLNKAFENIRATGGMAQTIVAHPSQAKRFSAMNQQNNNPVVFRADNIAGNYVKGFVSDFGDMADIVYLYQMPKDQVAVIDPTKIRLRPMAGRGFIDEPAVVDYDGVKRIIRGEYSLEVKDSATSHSYIHNLTV